MKGSWPIAELAGKRLLVTGATGFIGSRLCRKAAALGLRVHAVSRQPLSVSFHSSPDELCWEQVDLADSEATETLFRRVRPDFVAHLASEVTGERDRGMILPTLQANLVAAINVMLGADVVGCRRVVLAGSIEEPTFDGHEESAHSPYAAAKWSTHAYARLFHMLYELPVVHLRLSMVYGPGQRDLRKLVPYVTTALLRGEVPRLMSGTREVDWIYVDDVVEAFLRALTAPDIDGKSLDIGCGEPVAVSQVVGRLRRLIGGDVEPMFGALPDRRLERVCIANPDIAREAMDWRPRTSLNKGLARTVDFYRGMGDTRAPRHVGFNWANLGSVVAFVLMFTPDMLPT